MKHKMIFKLTILIILVLIGYISYISSLNGLPQWFFKIMKSLLIIILTLLACIVCDIKAYWMGYFEGSIWGAKNYEEKMIADVENIIDKAKKGEGEEIDVG